MVKKLNGKWRICIDFIDLNKTCPKDSFHLPRIDQLVDTTARHELLTFMDAYSRYNQIQMYPPNRKNTSFITNKDMYCYNVMPFRLNMQEQHIKCWSIKCFIARLEEIWRSA